MDSTIVNSEVFAVYVEHLLVPYLRPGNLVLLDNVKFPYAPKAIALREAAGARGLHIPAYSPDFNPIEECISKIKAVLRSLKARTKRTLSNALAKALAMVTVNDIRGWFEHCDYQILAEDAGRQPGGECQMLINCNPLQAPRA